MKRFNKINEGVEPIVVKKLADAFKAGPAKTREFLDSEEGKSDEVRGLLKQPKLDGIEKDDVVNIEDAPGTSVTNLIPTQNFIDLMQSVSFPLSSKDDLVKAITVKKGFGTIIISPDQSGTLIIDGHHRWSGVYGISPDGTIDAKSVQWPGLGTKEKLAAAQLAIAAWQGPGKNIPSKGGEPRFNILGKSKEEISKLITGNAGNPELVDAKVKDKGGILNDNMIQDIISDPESQKIVYNWAGIKEGEKNIDIIKKTIADKVGDNLSKMKFNEFAPPRQDMPQFDPDVKGPKFSEIEADLKSGNLNVSPPFVKMETASEGKVIKTYEKFINKWKKGEI